MRCLPRTFIHQATLIAAALFALAGLAGCGAEAPDDPVDEASEALAGDSLVATPSSVVFERIPVGLISSSTVSLFNTGPSEVDVYEIKMFPPDPCKPQLIIPCVRPGDSTELVISCRPTVAGDFSTMAVLRYRDGDGDRHTVRVPVSGTALN